MEKILGIVKEYQQLIIYRHVNPDLDAFGSQLGVYWTLKKIYPDKNIVLAGNMESRLLSLFATYEKGRAEQEKTTLGIVLDTANRERIDGDLCVCDDILKIDHHIVIDSYGDINIEVENASSCSEIITLLFKEENVTLPKAAAAALYLGIVGDSHRFLYNTTSSKTFVAASYLLETGIDIESLYQKLYMKNQTDLEVTKFIYNQYQSEGKIAWYYLSDQDLQTLNIGREEGSSYVNTLADYEDYLVWMAVTQNLAENNYRVSIRSRGVAIHEIANEFRGGGHAYASGATLLSLDELKDLIERLKVKIDESII